MKSSNLLSASPSILALALGVSLGAPYASAATDIASEKAGPPREYAQTTLVAVEVKAELAAEPSKVWSQVIRKEILVRMIGFEDAKGDDALGTPGAKLAGRIGGDQGMLIVTHAKADREIRYAWEPEHGGYVCHFTLKLSPSGKGTMVSLVDAYSDEKPALIAKNAADSRAHLAQSLETLKKSVE
ncbi:MAG: hypothetical protein JWP91_162 [Fibrobacteres bacterium]|nr:hypothetical protein [Fibrobacterota bacterium]